LNTTEDDAKARNMLPSKRDNLFSNHRVFLYHGRLLPKELYPMVETLDEMRVTLQLSYIEYEVEFDGSHITDLIPDLIEYLRDLIDAAKAIEVEIRARLREQRRDDFILGNPLEKRKMVEGLF
jgi:hypothetical protein